MEKTTSSSSEDESEDVSVSNKEADDMESLANVLEIDLDNDEIDPIKALDEPCTNHKTSSSRESLCAAKPHLLDEAPVEMNEHDVRLFPAHEDERVNLDDEIINDIPSLSESKESVERSPQLKKRQYKFIESIVDNDMMAQIEAMANRVDQCPYCELLCCQEFPCAMRSIKERCQS
jgi:transcriptional regulator with PAS, ATPase and Fis domain